MTNFLNSTFCNLEGHQRMERRFGLWCTNGRPPARHPDGNQVRVFNGRGEVELTASGGFRATRVVAHTWTGRGFPGGSNINALTSDG